MKIRTKVIGVMSGGIVAIIALFVFFWFRNRLEHTEVGEITQMQTIKEIAREKAAVEVYSHQAEQVKEQTQQKLELERLEQEKQWSLRELEEMKMEELKSQRLLQRDEYNRYGGDSWKRKWESVELLHQKQAQQKLELERLEQEIQQLEKTVKQQQEAQRQAAALDVLDQTLEKLEFANIAFNTPKTLNLHDTVIIRLVLGLKISTDELIQTLTAPGEKEGARIRVSNYMEARLSGPNFTITTITPEKQAVSRNNITEWKWEIKPNSIGTHYLHLTLSALLSVDNSSMSRTIRTFDKVIEVKVVWYQHVGLFFKEYWQWLWTALLVPIAGWLWKKKKESKPEHNQSNS